MVRSPGLVLQNDMLVIKLVISGFDDVMMRGKVRFLGKKEETSEALDT